ncbi:hypothetical protein [Paraburkholderia azotifigens]|uniref:Uncharacterized protein n=1 Tax=Paraburkholderia azotifigens TaxID=2057004 RepID=A0ABU9R2W4_9BURK
MKVTSKSIKSTTWNRLRDAHSDFDRNVQANLTFATRLYYGTIEQAGIARVAVRVGGGHVNGA